MRGKQPNTAGFSEPMLPVRGLMNRRTRESMKPAKTDEALLTEFVEGRRAALGELARRHERSLLGLASGMLDGRQDFAKDAVQETWVRVIRFGHRFNRQSSFKTWLYRIAINQCRNLASAMPGPAVSTEEPASENAAPNHDSNDPDRPDNAIQTAERNDMLRWAVERLGPDKKAVLLLCYHEGLTHEEAAEILEIPVGTLKSRLNAALTKLRGRLSPEMKP